MLRRLHEYINILLQRGLKPAHGKAKLSQVTQAINNEEL